MVIIDLIDEYHVPKVVYVSCNPAILRPDTALMIENGYEMKYTIPVDIFAQTRLFEVISLLTITEYT